jgi:flavoprotein
LKKIIKDRKDLDKDVEKLYNDFRKLEKENKDMKVLLSKARQFMMMFFVLHKTVHKLYNNNKINDIMKKLDFFNNQLIPVQKECEQFFQKHK